MPTGSRRSCRRPLDQPSTAPQFSVVSQRPNPDGAVPAQGQAAAEGLLARWRRSAASERANYGLFLIELCDLLGLPHPQPATGEIDRDEYVFEHPVQFQNNDGSTSLGFIDLYRRNSFVLETKQGCEANQEKTLLAACRTKRIRATI
jgi:hypothetical protein